MLEERGPIAVVRLARPEKRNALDLEAWRLMGAHLARACGRRGPGRVVALAGSGGFFSAGDDIRAMLSLETPGEARGFFEALAGAVWSLLTCGKPTMAVLEGPAVGGGAEIVLAVDYSIASRRAWLSYPEAHLALIPPILSTLGFLLLGRRAWRLAATGATLTAEEAARLGIVDEVVEPGEEWARAAAVAERLASLPYGVAAAVRRASLRLALNALEAAVDDLSSLVLGAEAKSRMRAFLEGFRWVSKPGLGDNK
ncbi:MAG: enoyl-CoA hydratase/isomerase family protein [Desulfurococcales archaeon]|nr:enoyl-CoA hydratase/isomerase family protein [Desulfurococcales archaeon]